MKNSIIAICCIFFLFAKNETLLDVKWETAYSFNKCNLFKMEFYAKNNELMTTTQQKTHFKNEDENFYIQYNVDKKGGSEVVIDKKNNVAIQILSKGTNMEYYNAGGFKYPSDADLKKLEVLPANETKQIAGYTCKKYTYTHKKIFGEVWITDQIKLSNDLGVFRACKMAALHNTLSIPGFVMEMTTEDARGGKTLMTTVALNKNEDCTISFKGIKMNTAINKVNYYIF